ncbi:MAG: class I SAM-dependent methyltransferase [Alphaproteobacteria bacterium]|nr:class I SAM-dependent methyltransferase [Alphaproteobacteria bacterium]
MKSKNPVLDKIYNLSGKPEECVDAYKDWAKTYDQDTVGGMNYVGPKISAKRLAALVGPDARILDAGCGTGLAGVELAELGFKTIDGMDISPDMLGEARKKGPYRELQVEDMTKPLSYETDAYDAVVCVGTFTHAHVGPKGFNELIRVTKPGGPIVATVHEDVWPDGYEDHFRALEADGRARVKSISEEDYHVHKCKLVTLEVL